ncbi:YegP family protein [Lysobacter terrae]
MAGWFELKKTINDQFHFTLKAGNGEVILSGETYTTRAAANNGIASVQVNAGNVDRYFRATASNGKRYFALKAGNGQIIGNGQMYGSEATLEDGIQSVMANGATTDVRDNS